MGDKLDAQPDSTPADEEKWPIGFMLIVTLAALYLGWRLVQMLGWLVTWAF